MMSVVQPTTNWHLLVDLIRSIQFRLHCITDMNDFLMDSSVSYFLVLAFADTRFFIVLAEVTVFQSQCYGVYLCMLTFPQY